VNILILEDDNLRIRQFKMNLIGHYVAFVDTVNDFEYLYKRGDFKWDIVFLDYDLDIVGDGKPGYVHDYANNNGQKAVDFIVNRALHPMCGGLPNTTFVVHSANDPAAKPMLMSLRKAGLKSIRYYGCWQSDKILQDLETIFRSKELSQHDPNTRLPTPDYYRYSEVI
jgi:hypothetical protein